MGRAKKKGVRFPLPFFTLTPPIVKILYYSLLVYLTGRGGFK
jgi:hypothetical protein